MRTLGAIQRLDLRLLIDRQHDGVGWWVDIEADNIADLGGEPRIVGQLVLAHPVRLQAMGSPDALHRTDTDASEPGHRRGLPMGDSPGGPSGARGAMRAGASCPSEGDAHSIIIQKILNVGEALKDIVRLARVMIWRVGCSGNLSCDLLSLVDFCRRHSFEQFVSFDLGQLVTSQSRIFIPAVGLGFVLRDAEPELENLSKLLLRIRVARRRGFVKPVLSLAEILKSSQCHSNKARLNDFPPAQTHAPPTFAATLAL